VADLTRGTPSSKARNNAVRAADEPHWQISNLIYCGVKVRGRVECNNRKIVTDVMVTDVAEKLSCTIILVMGHKEDGQRGAERGTICRFFNRQTR
jgi:hypothetical protein